MKTIQSQIETKRKENEEYIKMAEDIIEISRKEITKLRQSRTREEVKQERAQEQLNDLEIKQLMNKQLGLYVQPKEQLREEQEYIKLIEEEMKEELEEIKEEQEQSVVVSNLEQLN